MYDRLFVDTLFVIALINRRDQYKTYHDKEWGLIDCVSFVVMREHEITQALTFDRHFTQAGFHVLMRE